MLKMLIFAITGLLLLFVYAIFIVVLIKTLRTNKDAKRIKEQAIKNQYPELTVKELKRRKLLINSYINADYQKINLTLAFIVVISLIGVVMSVVMWNFNIFGISMLVCFLGILLVRLWGYRKSKDGTILKVQKDYLKNNSTNELKMVLLSDDEFQIQLKALKNTLVLTAVAVVLIILTLIFENIF